MRVVDNFGKYMLGSVLYSNTLRANLLVSHVLSTLELVRISRRVRDIVAYPLDHVIVGSTHSLGSTGTVTLPLATSAAFSWKDLAEQYLRWFLGR